MKQMSIDDFRDGWAEKPPLRITKPVRLIELFAGICAQAAALERLCVPFEHHVVCEFDKFAIRSYNAIHGTKFKKSDVTKLHAKDLRITDREQYYYMLTYSFPCTDLSNAGKQRGMKKGSGTRSGLLWEVERILKECGSNLPHILIMENVSQVHGKKNRADFDEWLNFLSSIGYTNVWADLNAKHYGVPQNRLRTFMVSFLGEYTYEFPKGYELKRRLKDVLDEVVDEKYYLSDETVAKVVNQLEQPILQA